MKAEIDAAALKELVHEAVAARYCGDAFDLKSVELVIHSPRGAERYVTAQINMVPIGAPKGPNLSRDGNTYYMKESVAAE